MMNVKYYTLNIFSDDLNGGNKAGIVLGANDLDKNKKQEMAKKLNFDDITFISKSNDADFKLEFFTPNNELELCGHGTIGSFYLMKEKNMIKEGTYKQETRSGILNVDVMDDIIYAQQSIPKIYGRVERFVICEALNISKEDLMLDYPIRTVSTGLKHIIIPVKDLDTLNKIEPDFEKIKSISRRYDVVGFHLFALETNNPKNTISVRNFAPRYEINEKSATGTSNGALATYLHHYNLLKDYSNIKIEQGYKLNKPSLINVKLEIEDEEVVSVKVGGNAYNVEEHSIEL
ncbi:PhzF family phenazine biosynthesis protein [Peptostreptococcaceae bacterium AGR-M142]